MKLETVMVLLNITLLGDGLTSIGGTLRVEGDEIQAGTGVTNIVLTYELSLKLKKILE